MQSWGGKNMRTINRDSPKTTESQPTKSAILGLIRSSLGVNRGEDDNLDLKEFRIIIRNDNEGILKRDYSIAQRVHHGFKAGETKELPAYYLEDASFIVLIGHENAEAVSIVRDGLKNPFWAPFLGRRAYVPYLPVLLGTMETENPIEELSILPIFFNSSLSQKKDLIKVSDSEIKENTKTETFFDDPISWNVSDNKWNERKNSIFYIKSNNENYEIKNDFIEQYIKIRERFEQ